MIIHRDTLIELTFDPKSDILSAKWFNLVDEPFHHIQHTITELVNSINRYFVTKLLIDSQSTVSNVPDTEYRPLAIKLAQDLAATQLKKVARVVSENSLMEAQAKTYNQEVQAIIGLSFKSREFDDKESAWLWLAQDED